MGWFCVCIRARCLNVTNSKIECQLRLVVSPSRSSFGRKNRGNACASSLRCLLPQRKLEPHWLVALLCLHATPHHTTPRHATPRHATPRHATPRHATPRHATPRHATPRHATPHINSEQQLCGAYVHGTISHALQASAGQHTHCELSSSKSMAIDPQLCP